jgi:NAD(P)-dependent dehydrogenase (short-subunit alcohol dehydrogenase family)
MSPAADRKVAVVTGAGGAIGGAIASRLAADGFTVACVDRDADAAKATAADLADAASFRCDVRSAAQVARLRDRVERRLGAADVLVNVAGVFFTHRIPDLSEEQWDLLLDVNLKGTFLTCKTFLPAMIERRSGCIVNIASTAGIRGGRARAAYCASKGGVVLFTRALALDHGRDGVRISCVCPGLIDTQMATWLKRDPEALAAWERSIPAQRIGHVQDVAAAVSFLVSAEADYVHGAALVVDGGDSA